jgi:signal transduction histidine kinase
MAGRERTAARDRAGNRDRSVNRSVVLNQLLFGVVVLFVIGIQQLIAPVSDRPGAFFLGVLLTFLSCGFAVAIPWNRYGRGWIAVIPAVDIVAIVCLRFSQPELGAGLLWIFPVIWLSTYFGIAGVIGSVGSVCGLLITGLLISGDPVAAFNIPSIIILPLMLACAAATSHIAAERSKARRQLLRSQSRVLEASMLRARRQEALLADVLDAVDFGVVRIDADGAVSVMNEAHARLLRAAGAEVFAVDGVAGASAELYAADGATPIHPDDAPMARALRGEEFTGYVVWVGAPGRGTALSITAHRLTGLVADAASMVLISRDVTAELMAVRARDDLVASVSHELRTPLTSVVGFLELALDEPQTATAAAHLEVAERNASRMLGLITDILVASASASGDAPIELTIDRRPTDLAGVVEASVESLIPRARENAIGLDISGIRPCEAVVDAFRLRQVVDNLVSNAIKYNRAGGSVAIQTGTDVDGGAVIVVSDTGTGIAPEEMPHLFERFFRSESVRGSSIHGSGLGLGISRDIVRRHGGELSVESVLGTGTVASVRIPVLERMPMREPAAMPEPTPMEDS